MKRLLLFSLCLFITGSIFGQFWFLMEDHVKPSMVEEYEAAMKEYMAFLRENDFSYPVEILQSSDLHYYYNINIKPEMAELDNIEAAFKKVIDADPDRFKEILSKFENTWFYSNTMCYYLEPDLCYIPEEPEYGEDNMPYQQVWFCRVMFNRTDEFNELLKEFYALSKEKGIKYPTYIYRGHIGTKDGTYLIVSPAKNPADLWEADQETWKLVGEEGSRINKALIKLIDNMEVKDIWWLKEYSYTPGK